MSVHNYELNLPKTEALNCFVDHVLHIRAIGLESASRLADLVSDQGDSYFGEERCDRLRAANLSDLPIAQGLRTCEDFSISDRVHLKTVEIRSFHELEIAELDLEQSRITLSGLSVALSVNPGFSGLFSSQDKTFYQEYNLGSGSGTSPLYANTELTRHLAYCGVGSNVDEKLYRRVKRAFGVSVYPFKSKSS